MYIIDHISLNSFWNEKCFRQKVQRKSTHILCSITLFFPENRAVCEITWKNIVEAGSPQKTWHKRIACWIPMATNMQSEYVIPGC
jgi:hypothetical protein